MKIEKFKRWLDKSEVIIILDSICESREPTHHDEFIQEYKYIKPIINSFEVIYKNSKIKITFPNKDGVDLLKRCKKEIIKQLKL